MTLEPGLYVTATPIGNLKDITFRAVDALKAADLILCEDTRQTQKLCRAYGVKTALQPYHDHNGARVRPEILAKLEDGAAICLVSDAGTPLISDPGYKLVREARDRGIPVFSLPGPSAGIAALACAGAPSDQFFFAGFPPAKKLARDNFLAALADLNATLLFYETGPRLADSLAAMKAAYGDRKAAVARELTKLHEEVVEGSLSSLAERYRDGTAKGEIVVIVHPPTAAAASQEDLEEFLKSALTRLSVKDAAAAAAETLGAPKKRAYEMALQLKDRA
ncbi:MAG: 16S rRNA (cytidine(1402)-2'-O)-methyltransferase [Pseudomonadota bacterium]